MSFAETVESLAELPLDAWHRAHGARMVPFAGYSMPLQYEGIVAEHDWTRSAASLFDVSHMGQLQITGEGAALALERLLPADLSMLKPGRSRYSLLLDYQGGILDDLMITRLPGAEESFYIVVNGATKIDDIAWLQSHLPEALEFTHLNDRTLFALQGPAASAALERLLPGVGGELAFMQGAKFQWHGHEVWVGRGGYTGEDGFEMSVPAEAAVTFFDTLATDQRVKPAGLGARDSLRLEAGLPLYGHDITIHTDPVSAGLSFALSKHRRAQGGFPGSERILALLAAGPPRQRVGLKLEGKLPAREGAQVFSGEEQVGEVTSGGFSPTLGQPIAMAYVASACAAVGTRLEIEVRGRRLEAAVTPLPFVPHNYHRSGASR